MITLKELSFSYSRKKEVLDPERSVRLEGLEA